MSEIENIFTPKGHKALIPYLTVGYPNVETTLDMARLIASSGGDLIELGIPFSDPLADGTTIQRASYHALRQGVSPQQCLEVARTLRKEIKIPLVFMTYYNPVHRYGLDAFCSDCSQAGINGLIIPDLPPEEGAEIEKLSEEYGLDLIYLLAPTSTDERIDMVATRSRGFIYLVSLTGVTGARDSLPPELESFVKRVRQRAQQPLCVGFGISSPDEARRVAKVADGVIVGSRIIQLLDENEPAVKVRTFIESMKGVLTDQTEESSDR
jgi:tryptophan synthase alpha chain